MKAENSGSGLTIHPHIQALKLSFILKPFLYKDIKKTLALI